MLLLIIEKFKIGNAVKKISADLVIIVIEVVVSKNYSTMAHINAGCFNGKFKCACVKNGEAFSAKSMEWELILA